MVTITKQAKANAIHNINSRGCTLHKKKKYHSGESAGFKLKMEHLVFPHQALHGFIKMESEGHFVLRNMASAAFWIKSYSS